MAITDERVARFAEIFQSSDRGFGTYRPKGKRDDGKHEIKADTIKKQYGEEEIRLHLQGRTPLGLVPILPNGTCWWGVIDIDDYTVDHVSLAKRIEMENWPLVVCKSKSGGAHLFCFFSGPADASSVRQYLRAVTENLGHRGVEIFPKQDGVLRDEDIGNWLNMPYFGDTRFAVDAEGNELDLDAFLDLAEHRRISPDELPDSPATSPPAATGNKTSSAAGRNEWLFKEGVRLHQAGVTGPALVATLQQLNLAAGPNDQENFAQGPLTTGEVDTIAASINTGRYSSGTPGASGKPFILTADKQTSELADECWPVVAAYNQETPSLFLLGGAPVRLQRDETIARLEPITRDTLKYLLGELADWFGEQGRQRSLPKPIAVRPDVVTHMMETPRERTAFLPLERLVNCPVFLPDGSMLQEPGYSHDHRIYLDLPPDLTIPPVSAIPSGDEIAAAKKWILDELLADFPFEDDASRANAVAVLLLPFVRDIIKGETPLHLIEKPTIGTGATLLARALAVPAIGPTLEMSTERANEEEWRKFIFASLLEARPFIAIDNLSAVLQGSSLASALTASSFRDRKLGVSETISVPVRAVWLATGNNPELSDELVRRTISIRLDAGMSDPTRRTDYRHPDLLGWATENRGDLVWAAMTLVQSWVSDGMRPGNATKASYESWAKTIGGILENVGIDGFLENTKKFSDRSSPETEAWQSLLAAWMYRAEDAAQGRLGETDNVMWRSGEVTAKDLLSLVERYVIELPLGSGTEHARATRLGKMLGKQHDRIIVAHDPHDRTVELIIKKRTGHGKKTYYFLHEPVKKEPWRPTHQRRLPEG